MYLLKQGTFENQKMFQYAAIMCVQFTCIKSIVHAGIHIVLTKNKIDRHTTFWLVRLANTLWADVSDEDDIAQVSTHWMITLEKMGCDFMVRSGQNIPILKTIPILWLDFIICSNHWQSEMKTTVMIIPQFIALYIVYLW